MKSLKYVKRKKNKIRGANAFANVRVVRSQSVQSVIYQYSHTNFLSNEKILKLKQNWFVCMNRLIVWMLVLWVCVYIRLGFCFHFMTFYIFFWFCFYSVLNFELTEGRKRTQCFPKAENGPHFSTGELLTCVASVLDVSCVR